jgi:hypothetical protein
MTGENMEAEPEQEVMKKGLDVFYLFLFFFFLGGGLLR